LQVIKDYLQASGIPEGVFIVDYQDFSRIMTLYLQQINASQSSKGELSIEEAWKEMTS
jgi:hypothetical protein